MKRHLFDSIQVAVGYILSPLSWWNDPFINVPISYAFSYPFTLIDKQFFLPTFILGYWLSNLLGLLMLHRGFTGLLSKKKPSTSMLRGFMIALAYTLVIVLLVRQGWIPTPTDFLQVNTK